MESRQSSNPPTLHMRGEVLSAKGSLALEESDFTECAGPIFQQSLEIARANGDSLSGSDEMLLNLSVVDLQEDHYEEALEQSQAASDMARKNWGPSNT